MGFLTNFLLVLACASWCILGQVLSLPSHINRGPSPYTSSIAMSPLEGDFSECGISRKTDSEMLWKTDPERLSVVGGEDALLGDWPWMISLMHGSPSNSSNTSACGGTLISRQWVITAAHCLSQFPNIESMYIRLGELDFDDQVKDGALPIDIAVDKLVPHPMFSMSPISYDIALIRLKKPIHFTENIRPICLFSGQESKTNEFYYGQYPYIIGWGYTAFGEESIRETSRLQEASIDVVTLEECRNNSKLARGFVIDEKIICAGGSEKNSCYGDSGGPLMFLNADENRFYLGGVVSGGIRCIESPTVYTKVAKFTCWINEVTGEEF